MSLELKSFIKKNQKANDSISVGFLSLRRAWTPTYPGRLYAASLWVTGLGSPRQMISEKITSNLTGLAGKPGPKTRLIVLEQTRNLRLRREMGMKDLTHCLFFFTVWSLARPAPMSLVSSFLSGHRHPRLLVNSLVGSGGAQQWFPAYEIIANTHYSLPLCQTLFWMLSARNEPSQITMWSGCYSEFRCANEVAEGKRGRRKLSKAVELGASPRCPDSQGHDTETSGGFGSHTVFSSLGSSTTASVSLWACPFASCCSRVPIDKRVPIPMLLISQVSLVKHMVDNSVNCSWWSCFSY